MKHIIYTLIIMAAATQILFSTSYTIKTSASLVYTPDSLTVQVGDSVIISANTFHPLVQVSQSSWESKVATPLAGGFGTHTTAYTFVATIPETIYYVCSAHVGVGMMGRIFVENTTPVIEKITDAAPKISISPNPVSTIGHIKLNQKMTGYVQVKIYSYSGEIIQEISTSGFDSADGSIPFDAGSMENGVYLLVISDEIQSSTVKFIVIK